MDRRQRRWAWLSVGFSLLVLAVVLYLTVDRETIELLLDFNPIYLLLALLLRTFSLVFWAFRMTELSKALHYHVGAWYAFLVVTANLFAGAIIEMNHFPTEDRTRGPSTRRARIADIVESIAVGQFRRGHHITAIITRVPYADRQHIAFPVQFHRTLERNHGGLAFGLDVIGSIRAGA